MLTVYSVMPKEFQEARNRDLVTDLAIRDNGHGYITRIGEFTDIGNVVHYVEPILCLAADSAQGDDCDGEVINEDNPTLECQLPDGERLNGKRPEAGGHWTVTIRIPMKRRLTWDEQVKFGTVTELQAKWIDEQIHYGKTIFIVGKQNTGKTTFLNTMLGSSYLDNKVLVKIEKSVAEILPTRMCTTYVVSNKCSHEEAQEKALRESGEVFTFTEARTGEDMRAVMTTVSSGHQSFTTVHAGSVEDVPRRIESLLRETGSSATREQIHLDIISDIDFFVFIEKKENGKRIVTDIASLEMKDGVAVRKAVTI